MKSDDAALFERWRTKRDGDAFAELARRHAPVVYDLAARTLGDRSAAEDVVQEALLDLALEPSSKPAEVGIVAWLARFAICRAKNQRSSERARARRQTVVGARMPEESMPDDELERREELERALEHAEPEERAVLAMRYLHGWEYSKIARSLETSEGAARVRVHRALANVRNRIALIDRDVTAERVTNRLAGLPILPLSAGSLDAAIRNALEAAGVPAPATVTPRNRITSALRAGTQGLGVALLVAAAATTAAQLAADPVAAGPSDATLACVAPDVLRAASLAPAGAVPWNAADAACLVAPRPEDWDGGALARLARGDIDPASGSYSIETGPSAEKEAAAPGEAAPARAGALPGAAPSPPTAFRPSSRGACAANCDSGSSDGERADAFGGLPRAVAADFTSVVVERAQLAEVPEASEDDAAAFDDPTGRRGPARGRSIESLSSDERELVEVAAALVREVVVDPAADADAAEVPAHARRTGVREIRRQYRDWRRHAAKDGTGKAPAMTGRKAVRMNRVLSVLVDLALADGRIAGDLRWPDGIDVTAAIQEVMRLLAEAPQVGSERRPDIAAEEPVEAPEDATDPARTPELE